jgi:amidase
MQSMPTSKEAPGDALKTLKDAKLSRRALIKNLGVAVAAVTNGISLPSLAGPVTQKAVPDFSALALSERIRTREIRCVELMAATLDRVNKLNPTYNALVSLASEDHCMARAKEADAALDRGEHWGWMHGFPHAVKDLSHAQGFPTSKGSPLYRGDIATHDDILVERLRQAGALIIGKSNVPEFGLGSHSYNTVFGTTVNPYNPQKSAGGSSGGAAAALALDLVPCADGSDLMGSLRNPAAFNNVIGFRPTPGMVPLSPLFMEELPCNGPMGKTVSDTARLLATLAGPDPRAPSALPIDPTIFTQPLGASMVGKRIGWLGDLQGHLAFEPGLMDVYTAALAHFETLGCEVEDAVLPFSMDSLWETWLTFRHWIVRGLRANDYNDPQRRALLKPECVWEVEGGLKLTADDVFHASRSRADFYKSILQLFNNYDFLVLPAAQVFPFDASMSWPKIINGRNMDTYHRWMEVTVPGTLSGCPIAAVPAGFGNNGLPCGLQIIGPRYRDFETLQMAYAYEQAARYNLDIRPGVVHA